MYACSALMSRTARDWMHAYKCWYVVQLSRCRPEIHVWNMSVSVCVKVTRAYKGKIFLVEKGNESRSTRESLLHWHRNSLPRVIIPKYLTLTSLTGAFILRWFIIKKCAVSQLINICNGAIIVSSILVNFMAAKMPCGKIYLPLCVSQVE